MFGLGMGELLVIGGILVLMFGAKKLPGLGKSMGSAITNFKQGLKEGSEEAKIENKDDNQNPS